MTYRQSWDKMMVTMASYGLVLGMSTEVANNLKFEGKYRRTPETSMQMKIITTYNSKLGVNWRSPGVWQVGHAPGQGKQVKSSIFLYALGTAVKFYGQYFTDFYLEWAAHLKDYTGQYTMSREELYQKRLEQKAQP